MCYEDKESKIAPVAMLSRWTVVLLVKMIFPLSLLTILKLKNFIFKSDLSKFLIIFQLQAEVMFAVHLKAVYQKLEHRISLSRWPACYKAYRSIQWLEW